MNPSVHLFSAGAVLALALPVPAQQPGGDPTVVDFLRPVAAARARAEREHRLLFLKPVYGGMDEAGAQSYCRGSW